MADIPERLPLPLSERLASASQNIYSRFGREVDIAIGGIPFMLATTGDIPQKVETIAVRKDQFDTEVDPGEQSLAGWWRRSQSSFHEGAGFRYEPTSTDKQHNGFWDSEGVDVFEKGELTLLRKMNVLGITGTSVAMNRMRTYAAGGVRTNLCTNPSLETDTTGWGVGGANPPTIARSTTRAFSGAASCLTTWATGTGILKTTFPTFTATVGATYTVSVYVWVPTGSVDVTLVISGVTIGPTTSLKDQWVRLSITFTATATTHLPEFWASTPPTAGMTVYSDAVLVEEGPVAGPYFDGNSTNGAWSGTANLSTSTETTPAAAASLTAIGGGALYKSTTDGDLDSNLTILHDPTPTLVDGMITGASFYSVASDGTLYQGLVSSPGTATTWPCGTTPSRLLWGKHRLWMIGGRKLWQPNVNSAGGTTQNPIFTHPNQGWTYTCMAEGPSAMYFGGHDGYGSSIQAITFDSGGGIPTLSGATVTAVLPDGELVQELAVVAGQYVGIGTSEGFRMGVVNSDASITYGPLIVVPDGVIACTSLTTQGRFFLVGFRTSAGKALLYRVDTSVENSEGVFAYAKDISCDDMTGNVTSIATIGNQVCCTTQDGRPWYQSDATLVSTGWLQSSRIRFRTTELKNYKFLNVEIEPLSGSISLDLILEGGSSLPLGSITAQGDVYDDAFGISVAPMKYASIKISLAQDAAGENPTFLSYLLRALPAARPQRLITLPLICQDKERSRSGQVYGGQGYAHTRLKALQLLEDAAETLIYQDFSDPNAEGVMVTIESVRFVQTAPPTPHRVEGNGGILILELRTAAA